MKRRRNLLRPSVRAMATLMHDMNLERMSRSGSRVVFPAEYGVRASSGLGRMSVVPFFQACAAATLTAGERVVKPGLPHEVTAEFNAAAPAADADVSVFHGPDSEP
jgi:hypothetical protein